MTSKKKVAPQGATNDQASETAPVQGVAKQEPDAEEQAPNVDGAESAPSGPDTETSQVESATPPSSEAVSQEQASIGLEALGLNPDGSQPATASPDPVSVEGWPKSYSITNQTRMELSVPTYGVSVSAFGGRQDVTVASADELKGLEANIDAIAHLNGFGKDSFVLKHLAGE